MKLKQLHEARYYRPKQYVLTISERAGAIFLINGELYDVDSLMEEFADRTEQDPEDEYVDNILANGGSEVLLNFNNGWFEPVDRDRYGRWKLSDNQIRTIIQNGWASIQTAK